MKIYLETIQILLVISFIGFFVSLLSYFIFFDRLVRYEYKTYKNEWEKDGKPSGFLWTSPESTLWEKWFRNAEWLSRKWADDKPTWIWEDAKATDFYNSFLFWRKSAFCSVSTALFFFVLLLLKILCSNSSDFVEYFQIKAA